MKREKTEKETDSLSRSRAQEGRQKVEAVPERWERPVMVRTLKKKQSKASIYHRLLLN